MQPTDPDKFTDTAWEAVTKSQDVVRAYKQQQLEVEHLILALLEEPTSLATAILTRAEVDSIRFKQQLEAFTERQPKVGKSDQLYLGRNLDLLLDKADEIRAKMREEEISEGHIILAFGDDQRIGRRLFKSLNIDLAQVELGVKSVRTTPKIKASPKVVVVLIV